MTMIKQDIRVDPRGQVLGLLGQMHKAAGDVSEIRKLTDQAEVLVRTHMAPVVGDEFPGLMLTASEARFLARLKSQEGEVVPYGSIMDAIYFDKHEEAVSNILKVYANHLRRKMKAANYPAKIVTEWGSGYKLAKLP